jgi:hypothetical protein
VSGCSFRWWMPNECGAWTSHGESDKVVENTNNRTGGTNNQSIDGNHLGKPMRSGSKSASMGIGRTSLVRSNATIRPDKYEYMEFFEKNVWTDKIVLLGPCAVCSHRPTDRCLLRWPVTLKQHSLQYRKKGCCEDLLDSINLVVLQTMAKSGCFCPA